MGKLSTWRNGVMRRVEGRSAREIATLTLKTLRHTARSFSPAAARARRADQAFDRRWGTDTGGTMNLSALNVARERALLGFGYQASNGVALKDAMKIAAIDPARFTFIDYGSGKGRVVMIAAATGFGRAIGVEFAPELHEVALTNADRFAAAGGAARRCEMVLGDAGSYAPPRGPVFAYIYNSFGPVILREVLERLEQRAAAGEEIIALYVNPRHRNAFEDEDRWHVVADREDWVLYRPAPAAR
ncbi:hypothetical protein [Sphingomonas sp. IC-11]|uniref:hypothetical protein n=1 Tax=Sphingomonas sp. IC-11 TaxID=2898528 RepID=UPI001E64762A|nr:hypothetical protein [Sphingomonas sp. IC-11]